MEYEIFLEDNKYKTANENIRVLINNLIKIFERKSARKFYPVWRGDESDTKVFVLKLEKRLLSKYGKKRQNIITVRLRTQQLDIEVFNGVYCNGREFPYNLYVADSNLIKLYKDINNLFISKIINE